MLADIFNDENLKDADLKKFADDLSLASDTFFTQNSASAKRKFQEQVDAIASYLERNSFELSAHKTKLMHITKGRTPDDQIRVGEASLKPDKKVKFLGVILDDKLNWNAHITLLTTKARKALNLIKILRGIPWLQGTKTLVNVARALVRSRLTYGQEAFGTELPGSLNDRLGAVDRTAIRLALGVAPWAKTNLIYSQAGIPSLEDQREVAIANFLARIRILPDTGENKTVTEQIDTSSKRSTREKIMIDKYKLKHLKPLMDREKTQMLLENINLERIETYEIPGKPHNKCKAPNTIYTIPKDCTKKNNPLRVTMEAKIAIDQLKVSDIQVYTDGSRLENGATGAGVHLPKNKILQRDINLSYKLGNHHSVFTAEIVALRQAIGRINVKGDKYKKAPLSHLH